MFVMTHRGEVRATCCSLSLFKEKATNFSLLLLVRTVTTVSVIRTLQVCFHKLRRHSPQRILYRSLWCSCRCTVHLFCRNFQGVQPVLSTCPGNPPCRRGDPQTTVFSKIEISVIRIRTRVQNMKTQVGQNSIITLSVFPTKTTSTKKLACAKPASASFTVARAFSRWSSVLNR